MLKNSLYAWDRTPEDVNKLYSGCISLQQLRTGTWTCGYVPEIKVVRTPTANRHKL